MSTFNLEPPSLLRVPDALRALSSSTSISSSSSYGFDQRSKTSQSSQSTDQTLITPLGSVDSIFGNHPQVEPVPSRFPDLVPWDGLTDEQWKLHSLVSKAECAIKEADIGVFKDLDETFFRDDIWYNDDLYNPDEEFDAVVAVRTRLIKGEQTVTTRRALDIIDTRSGLAPTLIADKNSAYDGHSTTRKDVVEEIEDYAEDFEVGDDEVLEVRLLFFLSSYPVSHIPLRYPLTKAVHKVFVVIQFLKLSTRAESRTLCSTRPFPPHPSIRPTFSHLHH